MLPSLTATFTGNMDWSRRPRKSQELADEKEMVRHRPRLLLHLHLAGILISHRPGPEQCR